MKTITDQGEQKDRSDTRRAKARFTRRRGVRGEKHSTGNRACVSARRDTGIVQVILMPPVKHQLKISYAKMLLRTSTKDSNIGSQFWGCPCDPRCKATLNIKAAGNG